MRPHQATPATLAPWTSVTSCPRKRTRPFVGAYAPTRMLRNVVFRAVWPDDADRFSRREREIDAVEHAQGAEDLVSPSASSRRS